MKTSKSAIGSRWLFAALILAIPMVALFWKAFLPDYVLFANDGPLGAQNAAWLHLPQSFKGQWYDLTTIGTNQGAALPGIGNLIRWFLGPLGYSKFVVPISLWFLGLGAWFFFKRSGLAPAACILGGLAASLTTNFFSDGAWGAAPAVIAFGADFFALGALAKKDKLPFWIGPALAGLAVGINVMEAADIGALFSVVVAAYVMYQSVTEDGSPLLLRAARGIGRTVLVAAFAGFMAAYAVHAFVGSSVTGIAGTQQDAETKAAHWDFASQWSLPKRETLSLIIPGVFGDRVDFNDQRMYWGGMGRDASWERYFHQILQPGDTVKIGFPGDREERVLQIGANGELALPSASPVKAAGLTRSELQKKLNDLYSSTPLKGASLESAVGFMRHTGRGFYLGLMVVLVGLWAALQALRGKNSAFTLPERKLIWFWSAAALISLILAHGRFSPFAALYRWLYIVLPYASTVRSPEKFLHVVNFAALILFAYGIHGLNRRYIEVSFSDVPLGSRLKSWWAKAPAFDRRWVAGSVLAIVVGFAGWIVYFALHQSLEQYMQEVQIPSSLAREVFSYSLRQVGWFVLFLVANSLVLLLIFSGAFAGSRAKWACILIGLLLVGDLVRADLPYVVSWNYKEKYETYGPDAVIKFLAEKPYENRVAELPPFRQSDMTSNFHQLYAIEWIQQLFPYYNIQSLDIVQMSRMPQDIEAFERSMQFPGTPPFIRRWELTNTRYLVGPADYLGPLNQQLDPALQRFRILSTFGLAPKPGVERATQLSQITVAPMPPPNGEYALFEFTGALPRAKLYANWQTNSPAALAAFTTNGLSPIEHYVFQLVGTNNDFLTLKELASPGFDPARTVLLDRPIPASTNSLATNQNPGNVEFTSYSPIDIKLKATAAAPSVLLLNDRWDPSWQVQVDGKPAELLRCNFIMRGVFLQAGQHEVEFRFRQPVKKLYLNIAAIVVGLCLLGYAAFATRKESEPETTNPERSAKASSK